MIDRSAIGGLIAYLLLLTLSAGTVLIGLSGVVVPAFGYLPAIGQTTMDLDAWRQFFAAPGIVTSIGLALWVGLVSTLLAVALSQALIALAYGPRWFSLADVTGRFLLAAPHVAMAIALAFMATPSGLVMRAVAAITGADTPPDYLFPGDPFGFSLILGLALKELPFFLVVSAVVAREIRIQTILAQCASLGYGRGRGWIFAVTPQVLQRIRFPVFVGLAYAVSSVDQALILGPTAPAVLPVRLVQWFNDPDLSGRLPLAAGAIVLAGLVVVSFGLWRLSELGVRVVMQQLAARGRRRGLLEGGVYGLSVVAAVVMAFAVIAFLGLVTSSFAVGWRFPNLMPSSWSLDIWHRQADLLIRTLAKTAGIAATCAFFAPLLALVGLEVTRGRDVARAVLTLVLFLPLFIPDTTLMFGLNVWWVCWRLDGAWMTVVWAHMVFALPYAWLMLIGPHRHVDPRMIATARVMGAGPLTAFRRVTLPILLGPVLMASAVVALVSAALYLPTVVAGAGRHATLITESMALSSGGDRRVVGALAAMLILLPLVALEVARAVPKFVYRYREAMTGDRT